MTLKVQQAFALVGPSGNLSGADSDLIVDLDLCSHRGSCLLSCGRLCLRVCGSCRGLIGVRVLLLRLGYVLIHLQVQPANFKQRTVSTHFQKVLLALTGDNLSNAKWYIQPSAMPSGPPHNNDAAGWRADSQLQSSKVHREGA